MFFFFFFRKTWLVLAVLKKTEKQEKGKMESEIKREEQTCVWKIIS